MSLRIGDSPHNVGHTAKELEQCSTLLRLEESFILFNMISNIQKVIFALVNVRLEDVERVVVYGIVDAIHNYSFNICDCTDFDKVLH